MMKRQHSWPLAVVILGFFLGATQVQSRPYFNDQAVPNKLEDVTAIELALKSHLERTREATVCITNGAGFGSGVIVSKDGLVMTAAHVTAGVNKKFTVIMEDGTEHEARSLGLDSSTDAALLQIIDVENLPFVEVEDNPESEITTKLGDWVYSIGHSGGFDKSRGSVVRLGRIVRLNNDASTFQSDCTLIGGDSGGPLFNMEGILVGIHSRVGKVVDQNMHVASYDFFKKDSAGLKKWDQMLDSEFMGNSRFAKRPRQGSGFMGIAVEETSEGLRVTDLDEAALAAKEGVEIGDLLLSINGDKYNKRAELASFMKKKAEGEKVTLKLVRAEETLEFTFRLEKR